MDSTDKQKELMYEELADKLMDYDDNGNDNAFSSTSAVSLYLREISKYPVLTPIEERILAKKIANGDSLAMEKFINSNLRLVVFIAKRYSAEKLGFLDLIQEGNIGLIKAAEKFDYTKGAKFSSYAVWSIKSEILRAIANNGGTIRIPVNIQELMKKYKSFQEDFYIKHKRYATDVEVSKKMHISFSKARDINLYIYKYRLMSLNTPISNEDDSELEDFIENTELTPEEMLYKNSFRELIDILISDSNLSKIEESVIRMRYDFENHEMNSLEKIAKKSGRSKAQIRMIERKALSKLRTTAIRKFDEEFFI